MAFAIACQLRASLQPQLRAFSTSQVTYARNKDAKATATAAKKRLEARAKKREAERRKYKNPERMSLQNAINVLRAVEIARPWTTYELTVKTHMRRGSPIPRGRIVMPREPKPAKKDYVVVFAEGRLAEQARRAGADVVGGLELVEQVASGKLQATTFLCAPDLLRGITPRLGRILGPRGLMPAERRGTVTEDFEGWMRQIRGSTDWRGDKDGTIRVPVGKGFFPIDDLVKNVRHFVDVVRQSTANQIDRAALKERKSRRKPATAISRVVLSSTQGPGIEISDP